MSTPITSSASTERTTWYENFDRPNDFYAEPAIGEFGTPISNFRQLMWSRAPDDLSDDSLLRYVTLGSCDGLVISHEKCSSASAALLTPKISDTDVPVIFAQLTDACLRYGLSNYFFWTLPTS